jgi:hypothetical protein
VSDHHLDPPEEEEAPECCGYPMILNLNGSLHCIECHRIINPAPDIEPLWEANEIFEIPEEEGPTLCPHDRAWVDCDACYHASDLAYDAAREGRGR